MWGIPHNIHQATTPHQEHTHQELTHQVHIHQELIHLSNMDHLELIHQVNIHLLNQYIEADINFLNY